MEIVRGLLKQPDMRPVIIKGYEKQDEFYQLNGDYQYVWQVSPQLFYRVIVRSGKITDGGSRPRIAALAKIRRDGVGRAAFLIHDEIFRKAGKGVELCESSSINGPWERVYKKIKFSDCNKLFCRMLRDGGIPKKRRRLMYRIVNSVFGRRHWGRPCPALG